MVKITVCGAAGRMGQRIIALAQENSVFSVTGALECVGHPRIGNGTPPITDDMLSLLPKSDVVVDFTAPGATLAHLKDAVAQKKAIVIGTTGFDDAGVAAITAAAKTIPVVFAPNMSVGINVMLKVVADIARLVPNYDIEIVELHHNQKKDAPSGTAAKLFQVICEALGRNPAKTGVYGREGIIGARTKNEIGVLAVRAGDIVGDHTVYFAGSGERIEVTHRAHSRDTLASGALVAAQWVADKKPGLYDMQQVLGIK